MWVGHRHFGSGELLGGVICTYSVLNSATRFAYMSDFIFSGLHLSCYAAVKELPGGCQCVEPGATPRLFRRDLLNLNAVLLSASC